MAVVLPIKSEYDKRGQNQAETGLAKLGKSAKKLAKIGAVAFAAVGGAALVMGKKLIDAGERASTANARIEEITKSMGLFEGSTDKVTDRLVKLAEKTARLTGVDQNLIKQGQALLSTFKNVAKDADTVGGVFDRATQAAIDLAAAGFGSVETNAIQLGKALEDPMKGLAALGKSGVTFTADQKKLIKSFVDTGDIASAQELILLAVEKQVGGTAEATANASDIMKVAWSQLQEQLGLKLLPVFEKFTKFIVESVLPTMERIYEKAAPYVLEAFRKISGWVTNTGIPAFKKFVDYVKTEILPKLGEMFNHLKKIGTYVYESLAPLIEGVLVGAFKSLKDSVPTLLTALNKVLTVLEAIAGAANTALDALDKVTAGKARGAIGGAIGKALVGPIGQLGPLLDKVLPNQPSAPLIPPAPVIRPASGPPDRGMRGVYKFAEGGIVAGGAMIGMIGEAGPEAVIPLDKLGRMGGGTTININGGLGSSADIGAAVVNAIRAFNRQNGPANIAVA
jgi:phage-related protein